MSLLLASGSSQYLERAGIPVVTYPYAIGAWVYITVSANGNLVGLFNNGTATDFEELVFIAPDTVQLRADDGGTSGNSSITGVTLNTWHYVLGVWTSASDRQVYLDGVAGSSLASAIAPAGLNTTTAGRQSTSAPGNYISGRVAEVTTWDLATAFTANDIAMLAQGVSPNLVRFSEIVEHHPLLQNLDPTLEVIAGNGYTQNNTPVLAGHPPLIHTASPFAHTSSKAISISVGNTVTFSQFGLTNQIPLTPDSTVTFGNTVAPCLVLTVSIGNLVRFNNTANKTIEDSAANTVTFSNRADRGEYQVQGVTFTNVVLGDPGAAAANDLTFGNSATVVKETNLTVGNTITFANWATGIIDPNLCEYVGEGPLMPPAPSLALRDHVTFAFGTLTLDLRNPVFGDTITVQPRRAFNLSRGGNPNVFRDPTWGKRLTVDMTFRIVTTTIRDATLQFLLDTLGQLVTYTDPETEVWDGILTNPETAIKTLTDVGTCSQYEFSLTFIGEPQ